MCWNTPVTATMVAAGVAATIVALRRGDPPAVPATIAYFTAMEALQLAGLMVIDRCGDPVNESVTLLSVLHIVFQPLVINAFALSLASREVPGWTRVLVHGGSALSAAVMLMQLHPFAWAGSCREGAILCGDALCTVSGNWHLGWTVPYNGLLAWFDDGLGTRLGFPTYMAAAFLLPLLYGAWRFALFHLLIGPLLASYLTTNPNEVPAIWCLFSISIILISLSPPVRRLFGWTPAGAARAAP